MTAERTGRFNVRIAPEEALMLRAIASEAGLSASDVIRQFIRARYRELFGDKRPRPPKTK